MTIFTSSPETSESGGFTITLIVGFKARDDFNLRSKIMPGSDVFNHDFPIFYHSDLKFLGSKDQSITGSKKVEVCAGIFRWTSA